MEEKELIDRERELRGLVEGDYRAAIQNINDNARSLDNILILISVSALAFTINFYSDNKDELREVSILYVSWFLLLVSIILTICSYHLSIRDDREKAENLKRDYFIKPSYKNNSFLADLTNIFFAFSSFFLIFAIILIIAFVVVN